MRLDLHEDPAVIEMADRMEVREEVICGYLHKIWAWASRQCHAGSVTGVTLVSLGRVTNLPGFPEMMRDVGWLAEDADSDGRPVIVFPNFDRWLEKSAKSRLLSAQRQRAKRNSHDDGVTNVTKVSRSQRDQTVTTEEERRGPKKNPLSPPGGNSSGKKFDPLSLDLPFGTERFRQAWADFCRMRSEIKKPLRPTGAKSSLARLAAMGHERAVAALTHTTCNEWQGIREPEGNQMAPSPEPKNKPAPMTGEQARYQLIKLHGVGEARDWPADKCLAEYQSRIVKPPPKPAMNGRGTA